jgi:hypothetical protein
MGAAMEGGIGHAGIFSNSMDAKIMHLQKRKLWK